MRVPSRSFRRALVAAASGVAFVVASAVTSLSAPAGAVYRHVPRHPHATAPSPLKWANPVQVDTALPFPNDPTHNHPVSCPTTTLCVMVNGQYILTTASPQGRASGWIGDTTFVDAGHVLENVTCVTGTTSCAAVDSAGNVISATGIVGGAVNNGWIATAVDTIQINSISCPTTTLCVIVDNGGNEASSTSPFKSSPSWSAASLTINSTNLGTAVESSTFGPFTLTAVGTQQPPLTWSVFGAVKGPNCPSGFVEVSAAATWLCLGSAGTLESAVGGVAASVPVGASGSSPYSFTVTATDSASPVHTASASLTLTVVSATTSYVTVNTPMALGIQNTGASFAQVLSVSGSGNAGPYAETITCGAGGCDGVGVTAGCVTGPPASCTISGTLTASGTYTLNVKVTDSAVPSHSFTASYVLVVETPIQTIDAGLTVISTNLPTAVEGSAYLQSLSRVGGVGPAFTWTVTGTPVQGANCPSGFVEVSTSATWLCLNSAGTLESAQVGTAAVVPVGASGGSPYSFTVQVTDSASPAHTATASLALTVAPDQIKITSTNLGTAVESSAYGPVTMTAAGTSSPPFSWSVGGAVQGPNCPTNFVEVLVATPWLCLNSSGTLESAVGGAAAAVPVGASGGSPYSFTVTAADAAGGSATATVSLVVKAAAVNFVTVNTPTNLPLQTAGATFSQALTITGTGNVGPYTEVLTSCVPGCDGVGVGSGCVTGPPATCTLSGTITAGGTFTITDRITDFNGLTYNAVFVLFVPAVYITISSPLALPTGAIGQSYTQTLSLAGFNIAGPYTGSVSGPSDGLTITGCSTASKTCTLAGTIVAGGTFNFLVTVTDLTTGLTATTSFVLVVGTPLVSISCPSTTFCAAADVNGDVLTTTAPSSPAWSAPILVDTRNPLVVLTTNLPNAEAGVAYGTAATAYPGVVVTLTATGGVAPYSWTVASGSGLLSAVGLTVNPNGTITGTPPALAPAGCTSGYPCTVPFTVQATDAASNTSLASVQIIVRPVAVPMPVTVTTTFLPLAAVGTTFGPPSAPVTLAAAGGTPFPANSINCNFASSPTDAKGYCWSLISVGPASNTLSVTVSSSGAVTASPTAGGVAVITVQATDSLGINATATFNIIVGNAPALTSISCPSSTLCEVTDNLGNILTSINPTANSATAWVLTNQDAAGKPLDVITCPAVSLCVTGDATGNIEYGTTAFTVTTTSLPTATVGQSYTANLSAANGVPRAAGASCPAGGTAAGLTSVPPEQGYCWTVTTGGSALQTAGLAVSPSGAVSGLPTIAGTFVVNVQATDASGTITPIAALSLTVVLPSPSNNLSVALPSLPQGALGAPYVVTLGATGGTPPYSWGPAGSIAPGLALGSCPGPNCGVISGSPTSTGTFSFSVQVTDSSSPVKSTTVRETITIPSSFLWSLPVHADPRLTGNAIQGLSCQSPALCVFADQGGNTPANPGGNVESTSTPTGPPSAWVTAANQLTSGSCPTTNLCIASDTAGNLFSWNNFSTITKSTCPASSSCWSGQLSAVTTTNLAASYAYGAACDPSAAVCQLVDAAGKVVSVGPGSAAGSPPWTAPAATTTASGDPQSLEAVSCPTSSLCMAADALGHVVTVPLVNGVPTGITSKGVDTVNQFTSISCPSLNLCVATDNNGNIVTSTTPGQGANATWALANHADGTRAIDSVSCPSASLCVAVDSVGNILSSSVPTGGSSAWSVATGVDGIWFNSISCPSTTYCAAVDGQGNVWTSSNPTGGKSAWASTNIDSSVALNVISCATASTCTALDANGQVLVGTSTTVVISLPPADNGVYQFGTGTGPVPTVTVGQVFPGTTVAQECATAISTNLPTALCASGGTSPYAWAISGGSLPPGLCLYPQGTTTGPCPATVPAAAATVAGTPTTTGTFSFTVQVTDSSTPPQAASLSGSITVSSPAGAGTFRWMMEGNGKQNPIAAAGAALNDATFALNAISCSAVNTCLISDDYGNTIWTTSASTATLPNVYPTWTPTTAAVPGPPPVPNGLGQSDMPPSIAGGSLNSILALACPPPSAGINLCVAGDQAGNLLTTLAPTTAAQNWCLNVAGNSTVSPPVAPKCATATGTTPIDNVSGTNYKVLGISCPSVSVCVAVDSDGDAITTTNANILPPAAPTWTIGTIESGQHAAINAISCPTLNLCVAVDANGDVLTSPNPSVGSSTWSAAHVDSATGSVTVRGNSADHSPNSNPQVESGLISVSCASPSLCVAVDAAGNAVVSTNPGGGSGAWSAFPVDTAGLTSVSCPSNTFCLAVDNRGDYVVASTSPAGGPSSWGAPSTFLPSGSSTPLEPAGTVLDTVTCPSTALCLATDQNGNVLIGILSAGLSIVTTQLLPSTVGAPYSQSLTAVGGSPPYTWSLPPGSPVTKCSGSSTSQGLPAPGLCLSPSGTISGVPTAAGTFSFTVLVTDSSSPPQTAVQPLSLTVSGSTLSITTTVLPTARLNTQYTAILQAAGGVSPYTWNLAGGVLPTGLLLTSTGTIFGTPAVSGSFSITVQVTDSSSQCGSSSAPAPCTATAALALPVSSTPQQQSTQGYWLAASNGFTFPFGSASCPGSSPPPCRSASAPVPPGWIAGIAATPDGGGYWLASSTGGVFTSGDASFLGSAGTSTLGGPIVGIAPYQNCSTTGGCGYWLAGSDGGVLTYGSAPYFGSMGGVRLVAPVVGIASTPDGNGYWLAAADGGIFTFGNAQFYGDRYQIDPSKPAGSSNAFRLNAPIVGISSTPDGNGYWMLASDGGVYTFGDAGFFGSVPGVFVGSLAGLHLAAPIVAFVPTPDALGYWIIGADGGVFTFGDAVYLGSQGVKQAVPPVQNIPCDPPYIIGSCVIVGGAAP